MPSSITTYALTALLANGAVAVPSVKRWNNHTPLEQPVPKAGYAIQYGPRPYYIINNMTDSPLKKKLQSCENGPFSVSSWSIGHRGGGTLQFPEETVESTMAGARMGAGVLECDVSFTKDRGLVCRHSLCDLHTTTNILTKPDLAKNCVVPFTPANATSPANAVCCTSDITIAEYQTLCGKQDGFNASAKNVFDYQNGTPNWRTELYDTCGTVMTLNSYIDLVNSLPGYRNFTPELKTPPSPYVPMPFNGYTQEQYARDMLDAFIKKGIDPARVWAQSFNPPDIYQWIKEYPDFAKQAIFLDEDGDDAPGPMYQADIARLASLKARGVNIISPPFPYLVEYGDAQNKTIVPSTYAKAAKAAGLQIITWTFERSGPLAKLKQNGNYYYFTIDNWATTDGKMYEVLDVLANQIGIIGIFSDWSATVGYFANCFNLKGTSDVL